VAGQLSLYICNSKLNPNPSTFSGDKLGVQTDGRKDRQTLSSHDFSHNIFCRQNV